jgi:hypothetical protein
MTESEEQIGFINWFRAKFPGVLIFHIPNGGFRSIKTAHRLKIEGVVAGIPDLYVPYLNLWIEMKMPKGKLSERQKEVIEYLKSIDHTVIVGYGAEDASRQVMDHLNEHK